MKEAIQKAVEGGYGGGKTDPKILESYYEHREIHLLSPLFWQALGKAEGWKDTASLGWVLHHRHGDNDISDCSGGDKQKNDLPEWHYQMHRFIDWIAEGKEVDVFFEDLSTKE